jgi:transposase InsO family protein
VEAAETAVCLVMKSVLLSARWAGRSRRLGLEQAAKAANGGAGAEADNVMLRDTIELLVEQLACAQRRLKAANIRVPYSLAERLHILWCIHYFGIPRRQIPKHFGVARSTVWRWLHRLQDGIGLCGRKCQASVRRTSEALEGLVWEMASANAGWGRRHISLVLGTLGIFLAASTVRNILLRPKPRSQGTPAAAARTPEEKQPRQIVARYPNHVWSADRTRVWRWRIWPTWLLVVIDHFSRKVVASCPLEGPNAGWVVEALEQVFLCHGPPKHLITDQEKVFTGEVFGDLLWRWNVKQRPGAVGRHGSIAVTERVIRTLKYEWLKRVPVIRGLDHLEQLLADFALYYNTWRPHSTLNGAIPDNIHAWRHWSGPPKTAKTVPAHIERRFFPETRITGFRLAA